MATRMDPEFKRQLISNVISSVVTIGVASFYLAQEEGNSPYQPITLPSVATVSAAAPTAPSTSTFNSDAKITEEKSTSTVEEEICPTCGCKKGKPATNTSVPSSSSEPEQKANGDTDSKVDSKADSKTKGPDEGKRFRTTQQFWSESTATWVTRDDKPQKGDDLKLGVLFVGNHRTLLPKQQLASESYWHVEVFSPHIVQDLRAELKEVETVYDDRPQLDAQDLFLYLPELKARLQSKRDVIAKLKAEGHPLTDPLPTEIVKELTSTIKISSPEQDATVKDKRTTTAKVSESEKVAPEKSSGNLSHEISFGKPSQPSEDDPLWEGPRHPSSAGQVNDQPLTVDLKALPAQTLQDLETSADHLNVLTDFIDEEFDSTNKKLGRLLPDGVMSWNLLWAIFKPGCIVSTYHETSGERMAFKLKTAAYFELRDFKALSLQGLKFEWNGHKFVRSWHEVRVPKFKGLRKISTLGAMPITEEVKRELTERGRTYVKLAGEPKYLQYTGALVRVEGHGMDKKIIKLRADGRVVVDVKSYRRMNPTRDIFSRAWDDEDVEDIPLGLNVPESDLCLAPPTIYGFSLVLKEWGELRCDQMSVIEFDDRAFEKHLVLDRDHKDMIKCLVDATAGESDTVSVVKDVISGKGGGAVCVLHGPPGVGKTLTAEAVAEHLKRPLYMVGAGELGVHADLLERRLRDTLEIAKTWGAVLLIDEADIFLEERSLHDVGRNAMVSVFLRLLEYHSGVLFLTTNRIKTFDEAFLSRFSVALRYPNLDREKRKMIWVKFLSLVGLEVDATPTKKRKQLSTGSINGVQINGVNGFTPPSSPSSPSSAGALVNENPNVVSSTQIDKFAEKILNGRTIKNIIRTAQALAISAHEQVSVDHINKVLRITQQFAEDFKDPDIYDAAGEGWKDQTRFYG